MRELRRSGQAGVRDRFAVDVTFTLPAGAATHTFRVTTLGGSATTTTVATTLPVPTPVPVPQVGALDAKRVVTVNRRHRFAVSVVCTSDVACAGTLKVRTARKVAARAGTRVITLAKRDYSVPAGGWRSEWC